MKNPEKNLPRVIHSSMFTVMVSCMLSSFDILLRSRFQVLFLCANVSYFTALTKVWCCTYVLIYAHFVQATVERSNTVALDFGRALFGSTGAIIFSVMVAFSCFGALNGTNETASSPPC